MIRYRLRELMADMAFKENKTITLTQISDATGISRRVLTSVANERGYNTEVETLDKLCRFFDCRIEQLVEYVPGEQIGSRLERPEAASKPTTRSRRKR